MTINKTQIALENNKYFEKYEVITIINQNDFKNNKLELFFIIFVIVSHFTT